MLEKKKSVLKFASTTVLSSKMIFPLNRNKSLHLNSMKEIKEQFEVQVLVLCTINQITTKENYYNAR